MRESSLCSVDTSAQEWLAVLLLECKAPGQRNNIREHARTRRSLATICEARHAASHNDTLNVRLELGCLD